MTLLNTFREIYSQDAKPARDLDTDHSLILAAISMEIIQARRYRGTDARNYAAGAIAALDVLGFEIRRKPAG